RGGGGAGRGGRAADRRAEGALADRRDDVPRSRGARPRTLGSGGGGGGHRPRGAPGGSGSRGTARRGSRRQPPAGRWDAGIGDPRARGGGGAGRRSRAPPPR